jgi:uncharacterized YigZ family protein
MSFYSSIEQEGHAEYKDRGSRFLAYSFPFADAKQLKPILLKLKKEHPKAVHFCLAYRIGTDGNNFRSTDDGEPGGSAGKPILGQIDSKELTDVLVIVVRYFGGTLLGVPGLINAYKSAAAMSLQVIPIIRKPILKKYQMQFDYTQMNEVIIVLKQCNCEVLSQENQLFTTMQVGVPQERVEEVVYKMEKLRNVEMIMLV